MECWIAVFSMMKQKNKEPKENSLGNHCLILRDMHGYTKLSFCKYCTCLCVPTNDFVAQKCNLCTLDSLLNPLVCGCMCVCVCVCVWGTYQVYITNSV
ncbi:unnamed protein product [Arctogadus glacialis]